MNRTSLAASWCPIARSLGSLGDPWALLVLRDALAGLTRFDQFEQSLGVAPNILSGRLKQLVADGLLERHRYSERPPRYEYRLTPVGLDTKSIMFALLDWGNRHLAPEGRSVVLIDEDTGQEARPLIVDQTTGLPLTAPRFRLAAGPAAPPAIFRRLEAGRERDRPATR